MVKASDTDYFINLPSVGTFRFKRKTFKMRAEIRANYLKIVKDLDADNDLELSAYSAILAAFPVICVEAPNGWDDITNMPLTDEIDNQIFLLFERLQSEEATFRRGSGKTLPESGEGTDSDLRLVGETEVQPGAN